MGSVRFRVTTGCEVERPLLPPAWEPIQRRAVSVSADKISLPGTLQHRKQPAHRVLQY